MSICCHRCRTPLRAEDVNVQALVGSCRQCDTVFAISPVEVQRPPAPRAPVPMPEHLRLETQPGGFEVTYAWYSPIYYVLIFFCLLWNGFLVGWYSLAFGSGDAFWIMALFPLLHVAVGAGLIYTTVAGFLNRTVVRVRKGHLVIEHRPLPWPGNRTIPVHELEQLYCKQEISRSRNGVSVTYQLRAVLHSGKMIKLLTGLDTAEPVLFLEELIESELGIVDRPVPDELKAGAQLT